MVWGLFSWWAVQNSNRAAAHSAISKATVRLCLARGSQRLGMSTKKDAARPFGLGIFCGGRYRARTAAEATAACGGNREPRLGQRSDFSKPCQGAAEKSANATRTGASRQIPSRFPTHRNVYQERCRQTIRSGDFFCGGRYRARTAINKGRVSPWRCALPFVLHPPILCVSGQSLRTSAHGRYARTQEKGQVLIYNSSLLLCNMIYSRQHNNCE